MKWDDKVSIEELVSACFLSPSYGPAKRWVAPAVQRGFLNPGKRQISVPGGGSTLTHHQIPSTLGEPSLPLANASAQLA
jgi:hypothetical protein